MNDFKVGDLVYLEIGDKRFYRVILDLTMNMIKIYSLDSNTVSMIPKLYLGHKKGYKKVV